MHMYIHLAEHSPPTLNDLLGHVLKLVDYGISGTPAVTVYRTLFTYYLTMQHSPIGAEITGLVYIALYMVYVYVCTCGCNNLGLCWYICSYVERL